MSNFFNYISSLSNSFFKNVCALRNKKFRYERKCFLIEGIRFVREAINNNARVEYIIINEKYRDDILEKINFDIKGYDVFVFSEVLFNRIAETESSQGIICCVCMDDLSKEFTYDDGLYILVDKIQDPGNLGTIIRTSVAVGAVGVILVKGTVDLYNDKVLRSTMGAIFKIKIYFLDDILEINKLIVNGFKLVISDVKEGNIYYKENLRGKIILAIGNEGNGVSLDLKEMNHIKVNIPMCNDLESLNAAQALSIIAFEYVRQINYF